MTLRLDAADDKLLGQQADAEGRSKQEIAREAIHRYLTDDIRRLEDRADALALARYDVRRELGDITYVSAAGARAALGLDPGAEPSSAPS